MVFQSDPDEEEEEEKSVDVEGRVDASSFASEVASLSPISFSSSPVSSSASSVSSSRGDSSRRVASTTVRLAGGDARASVGSSTFAADASSRSATRDDRARRARDLRATPGASGDASNERHDPRVLAPRGNANPHVVGIEDDDPRDGRRTHDQSTAARAGGRTAPLDN